MQQNVTPNDTNHTNPIDNMNDSGENSLDSKSMDIDDNENNETSASPNDNGGNMSINDQSLDMEERLQHSNYLIRNMEETRQRVRMQNQSNQSTPITPIIIKQPA